MILNDGAGSKAANSSTPLFGQQTNIFGQPNPLASALQNVPKEGQKKYIKVKGGKQELTYHVVGGKGQWFVSSSVITELTKKDKAGLAQAEKLNKDKTDGLRYSYNTTTNKLSANDDFAEQKSLARAAANKKQSSDTRERKITSIGDSDKDSINSAYDVWDKVKGVPQSVNTRSELEKAKANIANSIELAKKMQNPSLQNDIAALEGELAVVNRRLNNLSARAADDAAQTTGKPAVNTVDKNSKEKKAKNSKDAYKPASGSIEPGSGQSPATTVNKGQQGDAKKAADSNGFLARYGDAETAQKALYIAVDAIAKSEPGAVREFGTRGTAGYYAELKTKDGWVSANSNKAVSQLTKYAPSKEEAAALPALAVAITGPAVQTNPVEAGQLTSVQLAEKANFAASKPMSNDIDLGEAAKKSRAIISAVDMNSDGKLAKPEAALYSPADRNGNGKIGAKEASKFIKVADTNKSGVISAEESKAYGVLDTNNNGKLGKKEFAAYKAIDANGDGDITNEEAQKAYSAKVVTNQDKRTRQLAKEFIDKNAAKSGAQAVDAQVAALAGVPVVATAQNPQAATPATPAVPAAPATDGSAATPAAPAVPASPAAVLAAADRNDNGKVGAGELAKFESIADADASGEVTTAEAQAFALIDSNENGKIGKKELAAFRAIDKNGDGNLTTKEAKAALKAQIDSVQDKRTHDLAKDYLAKNPGNGGGSDEVDAAAAALVNAGRTESSLKKEAAAAKKSKK